MSKDLGTSCDWPRRNRHHQPDRDGLCLCWLDGEPHTARGALCPAVRCPGGVTASTAGKARGAGVPGRWRLSGVCLTRATSTTTASGDGGLRSGASPAGLFRRARGRGRAQHEHGPLMDGGARRREFGGFAHGAWVATQLADGWPWASGLSWIAGCMHVATSARALLSVPCSPCAPDDAEQARAFCVAPASCTPACLNSQPCRAAANKRIAPRQCSTAMPMIADDAWERHTPSAPEASSWPAAMLQLPGCRPIADVPCSRSSATVDASRPASRGLNHAIGDC